MCSCVKYILWIWRQLEGAVFTYKQYLLLGWLWPLEGGRKREGGKKLTFPNIPTLSKYKDGIQVQKTELFPTGLQNTCSLLKYYLTHTYTHRHTLSDRVVFVFMQSSQTNTLLTMQHSRIWETNMIHSYFELNKFWLQMSDLVLSLY